MSVNPRDFNRNKLPDRDMPEPLLSIIIPNYNGAELLSRNLPSVLQAVENADFPVEILLVDDASTDNSLDALKYFPAIVPVIREENGGFSQACNSGLAAAKGRFLLFLNSDATLEADFLNYFLEHFEDASVFAITPTGFKLNTGRIVEGGVIGKWKHGAPRTTKFYTEQEAIERNFTKPYPSFAVSGAHFVCDEEKMRQIGGFDPIYSPFNMEEMDLCYRALKRGWKNIYEPRMKAHHEQQVTLKKVATRFTVQVISKRNQMVFVVVNIQSPSMLGAFCFFLFIRLLFLRLTHWVALFRLIPLLPWALRRRREEKEQTHLSDSEVFRQFEFL